MNSASMDDFPSAWLQFELEELLNNPQKQYVWRSQGRVVISSDHDVSTCRDLVSRGGSSSGTPDDVDGLDHSTMGATLPGMRCMTCAQLQPRTELGGAWAGVAIVANSSNWTLNTKCGKSQDLTKQMLQVCCGLKQEETRTQTKPPRSTHGKLQHHRGPLHQRDRQCPSGSGSQCAQISPLSSASILLPEA